MINLKIKVPFNAAAALTFLNEITKLPAAGTTLINTCAPVVEVPPAITHNTVLVARQYELVTVSVAVVSAAVVSASVVIVPLTAFKVTAADALVAVFPDVAS